MFKKLFASFLTLCFIGFYALPAIAVDKIQDVSKGYWAKKEIFDVVTHNIMTLDENGNFNPEKEITRIEFVQSLLKILSNDNLDVKIKNSFTDVKDTYPAYADILRSEQLGLVYGYPNKTFQPEKILTKAEVTSVISHITKEIFTDTEVLNKFTDKKDIPDWAVNSYAKTTKLGLYVNYPYPDVLNPAKNLNRAEAAVLLHKLRNALGLIKEEFKNVPKVQKEDVLGVEHLNVHKKAPNNEVTITNLRKIIEENNVLQVAFEERFYTKTFHSGDIVNFLAPQDIFTEEGTLVIPSGSKLVAQVINITPPKWFNKNARVDLLFKNLVLPDGRVMDFDAKPFTKNNLLKEGPWMTAGKLTLSTLSFGIIGAGAGIGFGFIPSPTRLFTGLAVGIPVGCGVGLITGLVTKGLHYRTKAGEKIYIILTKDASIYN